MTYLRLCLIAILFVVLPCLAFANDDGAAKLKSIFENMVSYQKDLSKMRGPAGPQLNWDGDVTVEPSGGYYKVTLPHASLLYSDGSKLDFGNISINASQAAQPGQWKMAVALPTPVVFLDPQGKPSLTFTIGGQKVSGVWDESLENFATLDAEYDNVTLQNATGQTSLKLPQTHIKYDFVRDGNTWSGPASVSSQNISSQLPDGGALKIAEVKGDFALDRYNPAALKEYRQKVNAYVNAQDKPPASPDSATPPDATGTETIAKMVTNMVLSAGEGFKAHYAVSGFQIDRTDPVRKTPQSMKIANASVNLDISGLSSEKTSLGVRIAFDGLGVTPPLPGYEGILPSEANIDLLFHDIPARQLADLAGNTVEGITKQPEMAQFAGMSFLMKAPAIFSQAGTAAEIRNNFIGNDQYRFDVNGSIKADINAVNSVTGKLSGTFRGLDGLITKVGKVAADKTNPASGSAQGLWIGLKSLRANGAPTHSGADSVYKYDMVMTPDGQMLLNGKPFTTAAPAPATPEPGAAGMEAPAPSGQ